MKRTVKISLITVISLLIGIVFISALFILKMKSETSNMKPLKTGELNNGIIAVNDSIVNMYLIKGDDAYIAVDAGNNNGNIKKQLAELKIDPLKVSAVFLTHSDSDHVAALELFKNAVIYISKDEEQMVNGEKARFAIFHNKIKSQYTTLQDGQEVMLPGLIIYCILTPGHTPGSMCYLVNGQYLFTGDTLSLRHGKVDIFNKFFNMDSEKQKEVIKKLARLKGITHMYTAHHGMTDNYSKAFEMWK